MLHECGWKAYLAATHGNDWKRAREDWNKKGVGTTLEKSKQFRKVGKVMTVSEVRRVRTGRTVRKNNR